MQTILSSSLVKLSMLICELKRMYFQLLRRLVFQNNQACVNQTKHNSRHVFDKTCTNTQASSDAMNTRKALKQSHFNVFAQCRIRVWLFQFKVTHMWSDSLYFCSASVPLQAPTMFTRTDALWEKARHRPSSAQLSSSLWLWLGWLLGRLVPVKSRTLCYCWWIVACWVEDTALSCTAQTQTWTDIYESQMMFPWFYIFTVHAHFLILWVFYIY